jgi:hypothetical protein
MGTWTDTPPTQFVNNVVINSLNLRIGKEGVNITFAPEVAMKNFVLIL